MQAHRKPVSLSDLFWFTHTPRFWHGLCSHSSWSSTQFIPSNPVPLQSQKNEPLVFTHCPPFLQKFALVVWHSLISSEQFLPSYPLSQLQLYWPPKSVQFPCSHGLFGKQKPTANSQLGPPKSLVQLHL